MFCSKCGAELIEGSKFCDSCGAAVSRPEKAVENDIIEKVQEKEIVFNENDETKTDSAIVSESVIDGVPDSENIKEEKKAIDSKEIIADKGLSEMEKNVKKIEIDNDNDDSTDEKPEEDKPLDNTESSIKVQEVNVNTADKKGKQNKTHHGIKINKTLVITALIALLVGALVSGILTYEIGARPTLAKLSEAEEKVKEAEDLQKKAEDKQKEAEEYYADLNNTEVSTDEPKKVYLQGKVTVGVDIAPGMYLMRTKTGDYCSAWIHRKGESASSDDLGDLIANGYGEAGDELGEVILKAGDKIDIDDGIITFEPVED